MLYRPLALSILALSMACGRVGYHTDGATMMDGSVVDGSPLDSGPPDSLAPRDSAPSDTSSPDSGGADAALDGGPADTGPPDAGPCAEDPCRLVLPQCGCLAGQMCTRVTPGSTMRSCAPNGAVPAGGACSFSTECSAGSSCIRVNGLGMCSLWCETDAHCGGTECLRLRVGDAVGACRTPCDPIADTGCPVGMTCYASLGEAIGGAITTFTVCGGAGTRDRGATCTLPFECAPGLACTTGICEELCDTGAPTCAVGSCTDLAWTPVDGRTLGACR